MFNTKARCEDCCVCKLSWYQQFAAVAVGAKTGRRIGDHSSPGEGGSAAGSGGDFDKTRRTDDEVGRRAVVAAKRRVAVLRAALYNDTLVNFKRF